MNFLLFANIERNAKALIVDGEMIKSFDKFALINSIIRQGVF